jgi:hypothetical protein
MWPYLFGSGWTWGLLVAAALTAGIVGVAAGMIAATAPETPRTTAVRQLAGVHRFRTQAADADVSEDAAG